MTRSSSWIRDCVEAGQPLNDVLIIDGLTSVHLPFLKVMDRLGLIKRVFKAVQMLFYR